MARVRTDAAERKKQRDEMVEQVSAEVGRGVTVREAAAYRRGSRDRVTITTLSADVEVNQDAIESLGVILASIKDFRIQPGGYATLQLVTDGRSYADVLAAAALASQSHNLIVDLCLVPKPTLDDDEDDDAEAAYSTAVRVGG